MADKLMHIPNDNTQNSPFCRLQLAVKHLNTQLNEINQNVVKSTKLLSQGIRKRYYKTLGTSVINRPMSPPSLLIHTFLVANFWL